MICFEIRGPNHSFANWHIWWSWSCKWLGLFFKWISIQSQFWFLAVMWYDECYAILLHYTIVHGVKDTHDLYIHVTVIAEGQYKTIISISCQQATLGESTEILHTLFSKAHWNKIILFFKIWIKIHNICCKNWKYIAVLVLSVTDRLSVSSQFIVLGPSISLRVRSEFVHSINDLFYIHKESKVQEEHTMYFVIIE